MLLRCRRDTDSCPEEMLTLCEPSPGHAGAGPEQGLLPRGSSALQRPGGSGTLPAKEGSSLCTHSSPQGQGSHHGKAAKARAPALTSNGNKARPLPAPSQLVSPLRTRQDWL